MYEPYPAWVGRSDLVLRGFGVQVVRIRDLSVRTLEVRSFRGLESSFFVLGSLRFMWYCSGV